MTTTRKPLLSFCDRVTTTGLSLGRAVDEAAAAKFVDRWIDGTTTKPRSLAVLWMGNHLALIYWKPEGSNRGSSTYLSPRVMLVRLGFRNRHDSETETEVHDCSADPGPSRTLWSFGRLDEWKIRKLIERARLCEESYPRTLAAERAAREAEERAREDGQRAAENEAAEREAKRARRVELASYVKETLSLSARYDEVGAREVLPQDDLAGRDRLEFRAKVRELALLVLELGL